jgi:hypothetical protein
VLLELVLTHAAIVLQREDTLAFRSLTRGHFAAVLLRTPLLDRDPALALLLGKTRACFAGLLCVLATVGIAKLVATPVTEAARLFATRVGLLFASAALRGFHCACAIAVAVEIATILFVADHFSLFDRATLLVLAQCLFVAFAIAADLALACGFAHALLLRALFGCTLQGRLALLRRTHLCNFTVVVHPCPVDPLTLLLLAHGVAGLRILAFAHLHRAGVRTRRRETLVATLGRGVLSFLACLSCLSRLGAAFVLLLLLALAIVLTGESRARHASPYYGCCHHHGHCAQDACARQQPLHRLHCFPPAVRPNCRYGQLATIALNPF